MPGRVSGFGIRISDSGSRVLGSGFRVSGFEFRVSDSGFRVSGFRISSLLHHQGHEHDAVERLRGG